MFPRNEKPERGYVRMFPRNESRNEGTFAKTTLYETALLSPGDTCSESTAKLFRVVFMGYRTIITRYVANGVSHRCACVKLSTHEGYKNRLGEC